MTEIIKERIIRLRELIKENNLDTIMIQNGENRLYLSGFISEDTQFDESAGALFITENKLILATDSRFEEQAKNEAPLYEIVRYKKGIANDLHKILGKLNTKKLGFEGNRVSYALYEKYKRNFKENNLCVELIQADHLMTNLRISKNSLEVDKIKKTLNIAETAFSEFKRSIIPGLSEKKASWMLERLMREKGADSLSFPSIIASGPNSSLPHAVPGEREFKKGEPILVDWGAKLDGYCSDSTRTMIIGEPDQTFLKIFNTVNDARRMATDKIKEGAGTTEIDEIARDYIKKMGFEGKFSHGLGHGTGLAVHEPPQLSPIQNTTLKAGMIITVEPGIYIPGWGGIRLENMVHVLKDGAEVLNKLSCSDFILKI